MKRHTQTRAQSILGLIVAGAAWAMQAAPIELDLAAGGRMQYDIVIAEKAGERTRQAAEELAEYLGRITGEEPDVRSGDGTRGLAVGVTSDFPELDAQIAFDPKHPYRRDDYLLRSHSQGVYLLGATEMAAHLAAWDFLHHLGYRLYFPTDIWEIVPDRPDLSVAIDRLERPDYVNRSAPRGAPWSDDELWDRWKLRNRVTSSFTLRTHHIYGGIIRDKSEAFESHPEYYALVDGERRYAGRVDGRGNVKFCISNEGLRELVVDWAVEQMQENPERESLSMDPSDGGHWCECRPCREMGSVSDRVVTLANEVAEAINGLDLGPKYVGIYAYNQHSPPPDVSVHPNVIVSIATRFIRGGHTLDELIEGWSTRGATLGIRDYHDVFAWSHDRPRQAVGGDLEYLQQSIPEYYSHGARFMNSENADSWGANGLGYWITPRLLWDVERADNVDALIDDFLARAFGPAAGPMRGFYDLLNPHDRRRSNEDLVARMYRRLDEARQLIDDDYDEIRRRLDDLILYTRYLELYHAYRSASQDRRQKAFEKVWRHAYRIRDRMMVSTRAICDQDRFRDDSVSVPDEAAWEVPEPENAWKSGEPFSREETAKILQTGIESNEPTELDFEPMDYSEELISADSLNLDAVTPGNHSARFRGRQRFYTYLPADRERVKLKVTGGLIEHYRDRGNVRFRLYADEAPTSDPVARDESVPPDGREREVVLETPYAGQHRVEWNDGNDRTQVVADPEWPLTYPAAMEDPVELDGRWTLYFYVPRGTSVVGGFATTTTGHLTDSEGNRLFSFADMEEPGYFSVDVPDGKGGTLWKFEDVTGERILMTVPPYLAPSAGDLLLPKEVVNRDRAP